MARRECYHCKQWIEEGEAHDCWTTTEAALTQALSEDLQEAWDRLRETARMEEFADVARRHGLPDHTFTDTMTLFTGSDTVDLHYFGRAHTDGDAFIVFRRAGVLHAGDTFPGLNVVARDGGSEADYPSTMSRAAAGIKDVRIVIPGHGRVATWQEFLDNAEALRRSR